MQCSTAVTVPVLTAVACSESCGVLQCFTVFYSVLLCFVVFCSEICSVLQCFAVKAVVFYTALQGFFYSVLQCFTVFHSESCGVFYSVL